MIKILLLRSMVLYFISLGGQRSFVYGTIITWNRNVFREVRLFKIYEVTFIKINNQKLIKNQTIKVSLKTEWKKYISN